MKEETPNQKKKNQLKEEYESIVSNVKFDPKNHFPSENDMPGLGENQEVYDYESDMTECRDKAKQIVISLIKLHLGEDPKVLEHPMVVEKIEEDVESYASLKFMVKQSQRLYISNLSNMDNGQIGAGMTEAISSLQKEQRDTLKMLSQKFKEIDLGYRMMKDTLLSVAAEEKVEDTQILDFKKMNSQIDEFMKDRMELRKKEKEESEKKNNLTQLEEKTDFFEKDQNEEKTDDDKVEEAE